METNRYFLSAAWTDLIMLNYEIDPALLEPYVPGGVELDLYDERCLVSVVGFTFKNLKVINVPVLFHQEFSQINLRFYVRRKVHGEWRQGVVFVKEIAPKALISFSASHLYKEHYVTLPTSKEIYQNADKPAVPTMVGYNWKFNREWNRINVFPTGDKAAALEGSEESFIVDRYWGYTSKSRNETYEFQVTHPRWKIAPAAQAFLDCEVGTLYGEDFVEALSGEPSSTFWVDGSSVGVLYRTRITQTARTGADRDLEPVLEQQLNH